MQQSSHDAPPGSGPTEERVASNPTPPAAAALNAAAGVVRAPREIGGPAGPEPTRYGDWEKNGRCIDF